MTQLKRGHYRTTGGNEVFVAKIKARGMEFLARGSIKCPNTGALVLADWNINGRCPNEEPSGRMFDIILESARPIRD